MAMTYKEALWWTMVILRAKQGSQEDKESLEIEDNLRKEQGLPTVYEDAKAAILLHESQKQSSTSSIDINMAKKLAKIKPLLLKAGYIYLRKGLRTFTDWTNQMKALMRSVATGTWLTDDLIDSLIKDAWNTPYEMNGEVHTLAEWSTIMSNAELR